MIAWLWARTVRSPDPRAKGAMVPLISNFMLASKEGKKSWINVVFDSCCRDGYRFEVQTGPLQKDQEEVLKKGTKAGRGSNFICALTGAAITGSYIKSEGLTNRIGTRLIAIAAEGHRKRIYLDPDPEHEKLAQSVNATLDPVDLPASTHPQYMGCVPYGIDNFGKMFTARQMAMLTTFANLVQEARQQALQEMKACCKDDTIQGNLETYANAIATYLSFAVSRTADLNNNLCRWEAGPAKELVGHLFSRQNIPIVWDFAEASPFSGSSGDWSKCLSFIGYLLDHSQQSNPGRIDLGDAAERRSDLSAVAVTTDPPYYDNIPYADLSDFFYVWLRKSLSTVWPNLFRRLASPKSEELVADIKRHGGNVPFAVPTHSGYPNHVARRALALGAVSPHLKVVVVLVCKLDASGTDRTNKIVTMAGYVGLLPGWSEFEIAATKIRDDYGVSVLHAKEFYDTKGDFSGWSRDRKLQFVKDIHSASLRKLELGVSFSVEKSVFLDAKKQA